MITWLQKKHKYLMITMWISGISFIAAGFVGWGSYSFKSDEVMQIGSQTITQNELREAVENLKRNSGIKDEKIAQKYALEMLIKGKQHKDYMVKIGYIPQAEEVLKEISKINLFQNEKGEFDKKKYFEVLKDNGISPKKFEDRIKESLYTKYITEMFENRRVLNDEKRNISQLYTKSVNIKYTLIPVEPKEEVSSEEIQVEYEKNIAKYKLPDVYDVEYYEIKKLENEKYTLDELKKYYEENKNLFTIIDFKEEEVRVKYNEVKYKKHAQMEYIKIKKGETVLESKSEKIENDGEKFPKKQLDQMELNKYSKPFMSNGVFYVVKIINKQKNIRPLDEVDGELRKKISIEKTAESMKREYEKKDLKEITLNQEIEAFDYKSAVAKLELEKKDDALFKKILFGKKEGQRGVYYEKENSKFLIYEVSEIKTREANAMEDFEITRNISELKSRIYMNYFEKELEKEYKDVIN